jgi:signal transduction histidine kinase/ActR/RegA family two-component response regulator
VERLLQRIPRGDRVGPFETVRLSKDGRRLRLAVTLAPVRDRAGEVSSAVLLARDETDRKLAEEILQEQLWLLERVTRNASLGEILARAVTRIEEHSLDGLLSSVLLFDRDRRRLHTGAAPSLPESYRRAMEGMELGAGAGAVAVAVRERRPVVIDDLASDPRGEELREAALEHGLRALWLHPILSIDGEVLGCFASYYRRPQRPSAQDQILLSIFARTAAIAIDNAHLYRQVRRRARALTEANQRKNDFLAVLAHELRNPLGAIGNAVALIEEADGDGAVVAEATGILGRQAQQMTRLVDDLLDVSRIGRGMVELHRRRVELRAVVERAVESVQPAAGERGQRLVVELPPEPLPLEADPVRLAQVLGNLLTNAIKYSDPGSRIHLAAERDGEAVVVRVRDRGQGIEPDFLPHVFDHFARSRRAEESASQGLGLGLTLVRKLVEMHGGSVAAESEGRGRGTEMRVRLPLAEDAAAGAVEPASPEAGRSGEERRLRVLLVDDHEEAVKALGTLLELWGHQVRIALDGPSALEIAGELRPELVLLDIGLPEMDGWEVARRLRRLPEAAGAVLVALTGYGQRADRERSREAGFDHHLVKPVDPGELRDQLAEWTSDGRG